MEVDLANLALAEQVLRRQESHAHAIREHLVTYGALNREDMGLILGLLQPVNEALLDVGTQIFQMSSDVFQLGSEKMAETRQVYLDADQSAYEQVAEVAAQLGTDLPPYSQPSAPVLGPAQETAGVHETVDILSYLSTPDGTATENIRSSTNEAFGSADWIWQELFGYSLVQEISEPLAGDWQTLKEAAIAWSHAGDALAGVAQNTSDLDPSMAEWTGEGAEGFRIADAAIAEAHSVLSGPAKAISSAMSALVAAVELAISQILDWLKGVSYRLLTMAASAAVPVAGAAAIGADLVAELLGEATAIYAMVDMLYDVVSGVVEGKAELVDAKSLITDLVDGLARGTTTRLV